MTISSEHMHAPDTDFNFRFRYETLRSLLNKNGNALQILSDLEADLNHIQYSDRRIKRPIQKLVTETLLMSQELNLMTGDHYTELYDVILHLRNDIDQLFTGEQPDKNAPAVVGLDTPEEPASLLVGGKANGVWRLARQFPGMVPPAFVITTAAYHQVIAHNDLHDRIRLLLNNLDVTENKELFASRTQTIRGWMEEATIPPAIEQAIMDIVATLTGTGEKVTWAVRSSAVLEGGVRSFAGQFDSELNVETDDLLDAYRRVLAGRFSDRAVKYRIHNAIREVDTPMAVLVMPMIDPVAAGVVSSSDYRDTGADNVLISAVPGLADRMIRGEQPGDTFVVSKADLSVIKNAAGDDAAPDYISPDYISADKLTEIARIASEVSANVGYDVDIEWAVGRDGALHLLQMRQTYMRPSEEGETVKRTSTKGAMPLLEGGVTVFPGRAEGPVAFLGSVDDMAQIPDGAVVVAEQPKPEYAPILSRIAALLVVEGSPVSHLATMAREYAVPCLFRLGENIHLLRGKNVVSVNATKRTVYAGRRWVDIRERVLARIAAGNRPKSSGPLYDRILGLNLLDPDAASFKARSCRSVHDTLRFMHEMSVRTMFEFGDQQNRIWKNKSRKLHTDLPVRFKLIDLDKSVSDAVKKVTPADIHSTPFTALWNGISDHRLHWPERWDREMAGVPADFREAVLSGYKGPRKARDTNYIIIANDYINMNARVAYHYLMVDAMVGEGAENNHVHFRLRGGGAAEENRNRRTRFLELVLRQSGFGVDRRGDLITAWLRRHPQKDSAAALEMIGRLLVCARQLDVVLKSDNAVKRYADRFLNEEYGAFI